MKYLESFDQLVGKTISSVRHWNMSSMSFGVILTTTDGDRIAFYGDECGLGRGVFIETDGPNDLEG